MEYFPKKKAINKQQQQEKNRINIFFPVINLMIYLRDNINDQYTYFWDLE